MTAYRTVFRTVLKGITSPAATRFLGEVSFWMIGLRRKKRVLDISRMESILIVRLDEIGDVVLTTPFFRELRRNVPNAWITLVVNPGVYDLVELCPYVNEVLTYDWKTYGRYVDAKRYGRALKLGWKHMWQRRYDLAILPRWECDYYHGSFVTYFSGAPARAGYSAHVTEAKKAFNPKLDSLFTHLLHESKYDHEVERNMDMLRYLNCSVQDTSLELWTDSDDERFAARFLSLHGVSEDELLVAVGPGKRDAKRRWPIDRFIQVGAYVQKKYQARLLVIGSKEEVCLGNEIQEALGSCVINAIGQTNLRQCVALLKRCHLYIGNDYGPKHLASAAGIPLIEINAHPMSSADSHPDAPAHFRSLGSPDVVLQPDEAVLPCVQVCEAPEAHCILNVRVSHVKEAAERILNDHYLGSSPGEVNIGETDDRSG